MILGIILVSCECDPRNDLCPEILGIILVSYNSRNDHDALRSMIVLGF